MYLDIFGSELSNGVRSTKFVLKSVATKVPGRNNMVITVIVLMAVLSRLLSKAMAAVNVASFWDIKLYIYHFG
jgi:hypothetical protein